MRIDLYLTTNPTLIGKLKRVPVLMVIVPLVLLSACSRDLTRSKAMDLLKSSPDCVKPITLSLRVGGIAYAGADVSPEKAAESLGYLKVRGPLPFSSYYTYEVALTQKGEDAIKTLGWTLGEANPLVRAPRPQTLTIPIASCRIVDISGILKDGATKAKVDFTWEKVPNDNGKLFGLPIGKESGSRDFMLYDDGWRLVPLR
jgi:hypothetical protein